MIGVLVPAHNEEALIGRCLRSIRQAARHPALRGEPVQVVVALDRCRDGTARVAAEHGAQIGLVQRQPVATAAPRAFRRALHLATTTALTAWRQRCQCGDDEAAPAWLPRSSSKTRIGNGEWRIDSIRYSLLATH